MSIAIKAVNYCIRQLLKPYLSKQQVEKIQLKLKGQTKDQYQCEIGKLDLQDLLASILNLPFKTQTTLTTIKIQAKGGKISSLKFDITIASLSINIYDLQNHQEWKQKIKQRLRSQKLKQFQKCTFENLQDEKKITLFNKIVQAFIDNLSLKIQQAKIVYKQKFDVNIKSLQLKKGNEWNRKEKVLSFNCEVVDKNANSTANSSATNGNTNSVSGKSQNLKYLTVKQAKIYFRNQQDPNKSNSLQHSVLVQIKNPQLTLSNEQTIQVVKQLIIISKFIKETENIKRQQQFKKQKQAKQKKKAQKAQKDQEEEKRRKQILNSFVKNLCLQCIVQENQQSNADLGLKYNAEQNCQIINVEEFKAQIKNLLKSQPKFIPQNKLKENEQWLDEKQFKQIQEQTNVKLYTYSRNQIQLTIEIKTLQINIQHQQINLKISNDAVFSFTKSSYSTLEQINKKSGLKCSQTTAKITNFKVRHDQLKRKEYLIKIDQINFSDKQQYVSSKEKKVLKSHIHVDSQEILLDGRIQDLVVLKNIVQQNTLKVSQYLQGINQLFKVYNNKTLKQIKASLEYQIIKETVINVDIKQVQMFIKNIDPKYIIIAKIYDIDLYAKQTIVNLELKVSPKIYLSFFNGRSKVHQPIIQIFKANISYNQSQTVGLKRVFFNVGTDHSDSLPLKINVSTQMLSTFLAVQKQLLAAQQQIHNSSSTQKKILIQNMTQDIISTSSFSIKSQQKAQITAENKIRISIKSNKDQQNHPQYELQTNQNGIVKIEKSNYYIYSYENTKLINPFPAKLIIKNKLPNKKNIYIKFRNHWKTIEQQCLFPFAAVQQFQISLKQPKSKMQQQPQPLSEQPVEKPVLDQIDVFTWRGQITNKKQKFSLLIYKEQINEQFKVFNLLPPFVICNCLPLNISVQFIHKAQLIASKQVAKRQCHYSYLEKKIESIELKIKVDGYYWSQGLKYNTSTDNIDNQFQLTDNNKNKIILNYIFEKDKITAQHILTVYCKKYIHYKPRNDKQIVIQINSAVSQKENHHIPDFQQVAKCSDNIFLIGTNHGNKIKVARNSKIIEKAAIIEIGGSGYLESTLAIQQDDQGSDKVINKSQEGKKKESKVYYIPVGVCINTINTRSQMVAHRLFSNSSNTITGIFCHEIILQEKCIISPQAQLTIKQESPQRQLKSKNKDQFKIILNSSKPSQDAFKYTFANKKFQKNIIQLPATEKPSFFNIGKDLYKIEITGGTEKEVKNYKITKVVQLDLQVVVKSNLIIAEITCITEQSQKDNKESNPQAKKDSTKQTKKGSNAHYKISIPGGDEQEQASIKIIDTIKENEEKPKKIKKIEQQTILLKIMRIRDKQQQFIQLLFPKDVNAHSKKETSFQFKQNQKISVTETMSNGKILIEIDYNQVKTQPYALISKTVINIPQIILSISLNSSLSQTFQAMVVTLGNVALVKVENEKNQQYQLKIQFAQFDQMYPQIIKNPVILHTPQFINLYASIPKIASQPQKNPSNNSQPSQDTNISLVNKIHIDVGHFTVSISVNFAKLLILMIEELKPLLSKIDFLSLFNTYKEKALCVLVDQLKISPFSAELSIQKEINETTIQHSQLLTALLLNSNIYNKKISKAKMDIQGIVIKSINCPPQTILDNLVNHYQIVFANKIYYLLTGYFALSKPYNNFKEQSLSVTASNNTEYREYAKDLIQFDIRYNQGKAAGKNHNKLTQAKDVAQFIFKQQITGVVKVIPKIFKVFDNTSIQTKHEILKQRRHPRVFYGNNKAMKQYSNKDSKMYYLIKKEYLHTKNKTNPIFKEGFRYDKDQYLVVLCDSVAFVDIYKNEFKWGIDYSHIKYFVDPKSNNTLIFRKKQEQSSSSFFSFCGNHNQYKLKFEKFETIVDIKRSIRQE